MPASYNPAGGGGGSFDPHSPGPIGDVTPSTIAGDGSALTGVAKPADLALSALFTGVSFAQFLALLGQPTISDGTHNVTSGVDTNNGLVQATS